MRRRRSSVTNNDDSSNSGDDSSSNDNNYDLFSSTILTSRYGHESTQLIHVIEKNVAEDARQYAIEISSQHRMRKRGINFLVVMAKPSSPGVPVSFTRTRTNTCCLVFSQHQYRRY